MAVIPMWQVDRDKSMHTSKAEADRHDLMLEIGDHFAAAIVSIVPEMNRSQADLIGLFLAKNRDAVSKLCKGSHEALADALAAATGATETAVTPIRAAK